MYDFLVILSQLINWLFTLFTYTYIHVLNIDICVHSATIPGTEFNN